MASELDAVLAEIDDVLSRYEAMRARSEYDDCSDQKEELPEVVALMAAAIDRLAPEGGHYRESARMATKGGPQRS
ncbi:hypothetical protein [Archangium lansingense]|uniref:Uncharacterized protein n=1 Tax=Archangium lansingense TaxID=2995310 RepID=A0ABT3ZYJ4_9BACT|nr:hypothetical protein [Archangium lansinium]MCY1073762.1 hypothetical protein [Archangium lansinium]